MSLRNLSKVLSRAELLDVLRERGVHELLDFIYLPVKKKGASIKNFGYATLNAVTAGAVEVCKDRLVVKQSYISP